MRHGTATGYGYHRCRCDLCTRAWNLAQALAKWRRYHRMLAGEAVPVHGRPSTYSNWNCRCAECTEAAVSAKRARRVAA